MAKPKATHGINVIRDTENMVATFEFKNKATEKVERTLTHKWSDVHPDCHNFLMLYGMTKFCQDRESTVDMLDKLDAYDACFAETLKAGVLLKTRKAGTHTIRIEIEALAKFRKMGIKATQKLLAKYSKEDQEKIFLADGVQKEVAKIKKALEEAETQDEGSFDDLLSASE